MDNSLLEISKQAERCQCGNQHHELSIEKIVINNRALEDAVLFLEKKSLKNIVLVADTNTYEVAGNKLYKLLSEKGIHVEVCFIEPDRLNDVVANEESIVQLLLAVPPKTDVLLSVGAGTLHDITRVVSYKMGLPFISIPTAPSVDGFNSMGAPLVIKGIKKTYQTQAPIAVFADINILEDAPQKMIAAGFGDMLGKSTSLADWKFSSLIGGEPFCPLVYQITKEALQSCINNRSQIALGSEEGIKVLMESLINSGLAMLIMGQSHPASGAEHHISHYWEMDFMRNKQPQVLHGAKVSISCYLIADLYKNKVKDAINTLSLGNEHTDSEKVTKVIEQKEAILEIINSIPNSTELKEMVQELGGETEPEELGITDNLLQRSFQEAHLIRDRFTLLKFYNEYIR
ncbi:glycerol-1-phosphate dehydrogenase [NAD(P)+] [Evansella vedderi]|uniref:Glycerol-1-phosphate dehydrogenase [NAD(P)+] n=1 Tax=Evansella vedderi TaxID=38282 RepID=A0ABT9ZZW0_9BACI|nr:sn-glycerol-1-phosphate dehydrogenase [Evansella vedderi]MDQ0256777.1 glycerol-1-phosphate dehydrogenase [NAD(P)+] [Evansella vedderi]